MIFGMTTTSISMYLRFGRRILVHILKDEKSAKVVIPNDQKVERFKEVIAEHHPSLRDVWATMDGLKLEIERSPNPVVENRFYNGWTHGHYVTNILCFTPDGTIPLACVNVPGCIHDSTVSEWGGIYKRLESVYERNGGKITVDSAFCKKRHDFLIKSSQTPPNDAEGIIINAEATSMRQSAEWGMGSFQSSFPRILDKLKYEERNERGVILILLIL